MFGLTTKKRNIINYLMTYQNDCMHLLSEVSTDLDYYVKINFTKFNYAKINGYRMKAHELNHIFNLNLAFDPYKHHYEKFGKKYKMTNAVDLVSAFNTIKENIYEIPSNYMKAIEAKGEERNLLIEKALFARDECNKLFSEIHTILINA